MFLIRMYCSDNSWMTSKTHLRRCFPPKLANHNWKHCEEMIFMIYILFFLGQFGKYVSSAHFQITKDSHIVEEIKRLVKSNF